jgi:hypothetical protein
MGPSRRNVRTAVAALKHFAASSCDAKSGVDKRAVRAGKIPQNCTPARLRTLHTAQRLSFRLGKIYDFLRRRPPRERPREPLLDPRDCEGEERRRSVRVARLVSTIMPIASSHDGMLLWPAGVSRPPSPASSSSMPRSISSLSMSSSRTISSKPSSRSSFMSTCRRCGSRRERLDRPPRPRGSRCSRGPRDSRGSRGAESASCKTSSPGSAWSSERASSPGSPSGRRPRPRPRPRRRRRRRGSPLSSVDWPERSSPLPESANSSALDSRSQDSLPSSTESASRSEVDSRRRRPPRPYRSSRGRSSRPGGASANSSASPSLVLSAMRSACWSGEPNILCQRLTPRLCVGLASTSGSGGDGGSVISSCSSSSRNDSSRLGRGESDRSRRGDSSRSRRGESSRGGLRESSRCWRGGRSPSRRGGRRDRPLDSSPPSRRAGRAGRSSPSEDSSRLGASSRR